MIKQQKHVLLSILGRTPQILTEALYALIIQRKIPISEIWVLTTREGFETIIDYLIHPQSGKFYAFCHDWQIDAQKIKFNSEQILVAEDLSSPSKAMPDTQECEPLVNLILTVLRNLTNDPNTVLHCSLAGGRKTMSVYFAYALQFFGRPQDKLYHVLTQPMELQNHAEFYYIPPQPRYLVSGTGKKISTDQASIELIEVPYIRLRNKMEYLFGNKELSFDEMVRLTQSELEQMPNLPPLVIESQKKLITIGNKKVLLTPIEMAFYRYYAERSLSRSDDVPVKEYEQYFEKADGEWFPSDSLAQVLTHYRQIFSDSAVERFVESLDKGYLSFNRACQYFSRVKRKILNALGDEELAEYYIISAVGRYRKCYGIKVDKSKILMVT